MELALAYFEGLQEEKIRLSLQMGVTNAVSGAFALLSGEPNYTEKSILALKRAYAEKGLQLLVIEGPPALDKVKLGLTGAYEEMENFKTFLRACGKVGVPTVCYNWMPVVNWYRSDLSIAERGGATVTGFRMKDAENLPWTYAGEVPEYRLWGTLREFLEEMLPVAEEAGVDLALHPDDPPVPRLRGLDRILISADAFDRVFVMCPSDRNAMTFCQGCFSTMGEPLPDTIYRFADKIRFVHFRDVRGSRLDFRETFHDDGKTDMAAAMRAYRDIGFCGPARPDHVPTLAGEDHSLPSYGLLGNLFAVGYIRGLLDAVNSEEFVDEAF